MATSPPSERSTDDVTSSSGARRSAGRRHDQGAPGLPARAGPRGRVSPAWSLPLVPRRIEGPVDHTAPMTDPPSVGCPTSPKIASGTVTPITASQPHGREPDGTRRRHHHADPGPVTPPAGSGAAPPSGWRRWPPPSWSRAPSSRRPRPPAALRPFDDCEAVHDWYVDAYEPYLTQAGGWWGMDDVGGVAEDSASGSAGAGPAVDPQSRAAWGRTRSGRRHRDQPPGGGGRRARHDEDPRRAAGHHRRRPLGGRRRVRPEATEAGRGDGAGPGPGLRGRHRVERRRRRAPGGAGPGDVPEQAGTAELLLARDRVVVLANGWVPLDDSDGQDQAPGR